MQRTWTAYDRGEIFALGNWVFGEQRYLEQGRVLWNIPILHVERLGYLFCGAWVAFIPASSLLYSNDVSFESI